MSLIHRLGALAAVGLLTAGCTATTTATAPGASGGSAAPGGTSSAAAGTASGAPEASPSAGTDAAATADSVPPSTWPSAFPAAYKKPSMGGITLPPTGSGRLDGKKIVVDPGHNKGWITSINNRRHPMYGTVGARCASVGATGADGKTPEHEIVFKIAEKVVPQLRAQGATVILTRPDDNGLGPCNDERADMANRSNADFLISIHADGAENQKLRGWYLLYAGHSAGGKTLLDASKAAAAKMVPLIAEKSVIPISNYVSNEEKQPLRSEDVAVLNNLKKTRGVLIEIGNTVQKEDWAAMASDAGQQSLADGLVAGVTEVVAAG